MGWESKTEDGRFVMYSSIIIGDCQLIAWDSPEAIRVSKAPPSMFRCTPHSILPSLFFHPTPCSYPSVLMLMLHLLLLNSGLINLYCAESIPVSH